MKINKVVIALVATTLAFACASFAEPASKSGPPTGGRMTSPLQTEKDFHALKGGDQVVLVCKMSDSVQVIDVKDEAQAKEMCKEGTMVHCPDCKKEYKVTYGGNPSRSTGAPTKKLVMVNDKGEPCMFYAKLK